MFILLSSFSNAQLLSVYPSFLLQVIILPSFAFSLSYFCFFSFCNAVLFFVYIYHPQHLSIRRRRFQFFNEYELFEKCKLSDLDLRVFFHWVFEAQCESEMKLEGVRLEIVRLSYRCDMIMTNFLSLVQEEFPVRLREMETDQVPRCCSR